MQQLEILHYLSVLDRPAELREVATGLSMSRSATYRVLERLTADHWLVGEGRPRRYRLSLRVAELGLAVIRHDRVRRECVPILMAGAERLHGPCFIVLYDHGDALFLDAADVLGERVKLFMLDVRTPAPATSAGKVLLAHQPKDEIQRVISLGLPQLMPNTHVSEPEQLADLERARELGFSYDDREYRDAWGVSGPVYDMMGKVVAAIGTGFEGAMPNEEAMLRVAATVQSICAQASGELGYRPRRTIFA